MSEKVWFSEGRGRGFEIPQARTYAATNKARTEPVAISLDDLNKPGTGPMNFDPCKGNYFAGTQKQDRSSKDSAAY